MTNRDKINAMSNEELAYFLYNFGCSECSFNSKCCGHYNCVEGYTKWLESEVEE